MIGRLGGGATKDAILRGARDEYDVLDDAFVDSGWSDMTVDEYDAAESRRDRESVGGKPGEDGTCAEEVLRSMLSWPNGADEPCPRRDNGRIVG